MFELQEKGNGERERLHEATESEGLVYFDDRFFVCAMFTHTGRVRFVYRARIEVARFV